MSTSLGDLVRVTRTLAPGDPVTERRIAALLGLADEAPAPAPRARPKPPPPPAIERRPRSRLAGWLSAAIVAAGAVVVAASDAWQRRGTALVLRLLGPDARSPEPVPEWRTATERLPPQPAAPGPEPAVASLLTPAWSPSILRTLLACEMGGGPLDVDALVDACARADLPEQLPRRALWSLAGGAQLLVDLGDTMLPFRADLLDLIARARSVAGESQLSVLRFAGSPLTAGPGRRDTWTAYSVPATPRAVLAVTDLGLFGDARARCMRDWLRLAERLQAARCPLVALVPTAVADVPAPLRRALAIVEWDRATTVSAAARAVRRG